MGSAGLCADRRVRTATRVRTGTIGSLAWQCTSAGICPGRVGGERLYHAKAVAILGELDVGVSIGNLR
jgi:hypothetical protein